MNISVKHGFIFFLNTNFTNFTNVDQRKNIRVIREIRVQNHVICGVCPSYLDGLNRLFAMAVYGTYDSCRKVTDDRYDSHFL